MASLPDKARDSGRVGTGSGRVSSGVLGLLALILGQISTRVIGFVAYGYLARVLAPDDYGLVEYVVGVAAIFAMAVDGGVGAVAVKRSSDGASAGLLAVEVMMARLLLAIAVIPVFFLLAVYFGTLQVHAEVALLFSLALLLGVFNQEWLLQATGRMNAVVAAQVVRAICFTGLVMLVVGKPIQLTGIALAEAVSVGCASLLYLTMNTPTAAAWVSSMNAHRAGSLVGESMPIGLAQLVWSAAQYAPLFLVGTMIGGDETGWFGAAQRITLSLLALSLVYHFSLYPLLTRVLAEKPARLVETLRRSMRISCWGACAGALGLAVGAQPLLLGLFGPKYVNSVPVFQIMVWIIPITVLSGHFRWTLIGMGRQADVLKAQLLGLVAVLIGGSVLTMAYEEVGAAWAAVAGSLTVLLYVRTRVVSLVSLRMADVLYRPLTATVCIAVSVAVMAVNPLYEALLAVVLMAGIAAVLDRDIFQDLGVLKSMG